MKDRKVSKLAKLKASLSFRKFREKTTKLDLVTVQRL